MQTTDVSDFFYPSLPKTLFKNRAFSHDVTAAILVFQNNETAARFVHPENPVGVELFSHVNDFLFPIN